MKEWSNFANFVVIRKMIKMKLILDIKDSKATAFLNFIRSLDFITIRSEETIEEKIEEIPQELQDLLLLSEKDLQSGNLFSHDEVMRSL